MNHAIICYTHFLFVFEFKPNFTYKYFINNIINQIIYQFSFKSKPNNTSMKPILSVVNLFFGGGQGLNPDIVYIMHCPYQLR